jgi:hypothetical protein
MERRWVGRVEFRPVEGQPLEQQSSAHTANRRCLISKRKLRRETAVSHHLRTLFEQILLGLTPRGTCVDSRAQPLIVLSGCIAVTLVHR